MTINTTLWKPDTCECVIEYTFDTDEPEDVRQHNFKKISTCKHHSHLDDASAYDQVLNKENKFKNEVVSDIKNSLPGILTEDDVLDFSFDAGRNLTVNLPKKVAAKDVAIAKGAIGLKHSNKNIKIQ